MSKGERHGASFRDPSGFVFSHGGVIYRQVNQCYKEDYDRLFDSGLYADLTSGGLLLEHEETDLPAPEPGTAYKVVKPTRIPFVSYPYEWPFSALKNAALATLAIQQKDLEHEMVLKDASAYNIQFVGAHPILIDTLSFAAYREGEPWAAYRQFCQHFLGPLLLMCKCDVRYGLLSRLFIDGLPLDLVSKSLPRRTWLNFGIAVHTHLHARSQKRHGAGPGKNASRPTLTRRGMLGLIDSLQALVRKLSWTPRDSEWSNYYDATNYSAESMDDKRRQVDVFIDKIQPKMVWDLGANTGVFSRIAAEKGIETIAFDVDPAAVEKNYLACRKDGTTKMLPLVADLTNASPAIGWQNRERQSLIERGPADLVLALALVHHLAISNNVPLPMVAEFFRSVGHALIVEFVPKTDSQLARLLATRQDIFPGYTQQAFEKAFEEFFTIQESKPLLDSGRILYLMTRKG